MKTKILLLILALVGSVTCYSKVFEQKFESTSWACYVDELTAAQSSISNIIRMADEWCSGIDGKLSSHSFGFELIQNELKEGRASCPNVKASAIFSCSSKAKDISCVCYNFDKKTGICRPYSFSCNIK